jgi:hypothetical protein
MIHKNSVHTSRVTKYTSLTTISQLMLFTEIIAIYFENYTKHRDRPCGQNVGFYNPFHSYETLHSQGNKTADHNRVLG